jgi:hypothetical protein
MDPLTVFKDFVLNKQLDEVEVDVAEGKVRFADKYSFPASTATAFRREGTAGQYYPLGVVVHFFKFTESGVDVKEYIRRFPNRADQVALKDRPVSACSCSSCCCFTPHIHLVPLLHTSLVSASCLSVFVSICLPLTHMSFVPLHHPNHLTHTQDLLKYLRGQAATVPQLDETVPLVPFEPPAKRQKVGGACMIPTKQQTQMCLQAAQAPSVVSWSIAPVSAHVSADSLPAGATVHMLSPTAACDCCPAAAAAAEPEPGEADALQHLFGHEKQLRDRNSLLVRRAVAATQGCVLLPQQQ